MRALNVDGLFVHRIGSGIPLLLMHGGLGFDHTTFRPWLDALADRCELIYYDHRGNGRSARPDDSARLDHDRWVRDAEALRRALGLGPVFLLGHSYGGFLAQEYALRYPDSLAGLILCCTAPAMDHGPIMVANAQARGTPDQVAAFVAALSSPLPDDDALDTLMRAVAPFYFHRPGPELIDGVFGEVGYSAQAFNRAFFGCVADFDTTDRLADIRTSTLLLAGEDDWIMPPEVAIRPFAGGPPAVESHVLKGVGHFPWAEDPDTFVTLVGDWIDRVAHARNP